jgi:hypothetical protein
MVIIKYKNEKYWVYTPNYFFSNSSRLKLSDDNKIKHSKRNNSFITSTYYRALTPITYDLKKKYYNIFMENIRLFFEINVDLIFKNNHNKINSTEDFEDIRGIGKGTLKRIEEIFFSKMKNHIHELFIKLSIKSFIHTLFSMKFDFKELKIYKTYYNIVLNNIAVSLLNDNPVLFSEHDSIICNDRYCYIIQKILGYGSYGIVLDVLDNKSDNNKHYAIKIFNNDFNLKIYSDNEIKILKKIRSIKNNNLIDYVLISKYDIYDFIILEKVDYTLRQFIEHNINIEDEVIVYIIKEITHGIKGLHDNNIIHTDLHL